ncbi:replication protein RepA [Paracraurococcus lichenis]|uniref:Replication protein RepA n=1 Tax=Paracraurococcus lichenis TaxID=3064888 RepID=A0ABT9EBZ4_9PROT|nr:replication protein RepA [Paracraurococcus sp. LOR1-02]MDO9713731.1 replication protein RepA [Paracraurococcus sp. LOR1-02]
MSVRDQLTLFGLDQTLRQARASASNEREVERQIRRVHTVHSILSELPTAEDLAFLHSGLCQTCLPHSRPDSNRDVWRRRSGRLTLIVQPGVLDTPMKPAGRGKRGEAKAAAKADDQESMYVGVPYGSKARLILIYLQSEGIRDRVVQMGDSLSAWMRSLGLAVTGGERGTITAVREQVLRIARCSFSFHWSEVSDEGDRTIVTDARLVDGMELWRGVSDRSQWPRQVVLSEAFHAHLREHAVPLDQRAIAHLSGNSLGLDLYTMLAYRLPRLKAPLLLRWSQLMEQLGAEDPSNFSRRVKAILPDVLDGYPGAKIEVSRNGLTLQPSKPAVQRTMVNGLRLIKS